MSVVVPVCYTEFDDKEFDVNRPCSEETIRKLVQNVNLLGQLAILGSIRAIAVNTPGVPPPNTDQFQYCDGSEIANEFSPLRSTAGHPRTTPTLNDKYLRGATSTTVNNKTAVLDPGGYATRDLSHTHTTGFVHSPIVGEEGDERHAYANLDHNHGVNTDLSDVDPIVLANVNTAYYLKIN